MKRPTSTLLLLVLVSAACTKTTRTLIWVPDPEADAAGPLRSTAATLGIPPGHLPGPGQCRLWLPGTPPGRQPRPRSRRCEGIAAGAPAGSWIVYRPTADRKVVHVKVLDARGAGVVVRTRVFEVETGRLVREEQP